MLKSFAIFAALALISSNALACSDAVPSGEVAAAFQKASENMHHGMMIEYTNDPDIDFVRGMIPHHAGAVEMATIELKYGKDPELRKMAQEIIDAQNKEIEFMKKWQSKNDKASTKPAKK